MESIPVRISKSQALKAKRGKPVQLGYSQLSGDSNIKLVLHPANAKKVKRAVRNQRGCRLILSPEEIHGSGILDWLKNAATWVKKNVIDTPFYQKNVRPIARELVKSGVSSVPVLGDIAKPGVEWLGEKTGAFGLKGRGKSGLKSDRSDFLSPNHPTYHSKQPSKPPGVVGSSFRLQGRGSNKKCQYCGGSFKL